MPIGGSDGSFFDNKFDFFKQVRPGEFAPSDDVDENMVKTPSEVMTGKKLDDAELDPSTGLGIDVAYRRPLGSPTEPAGAFKPDASQTVPGDFTKIKRGGPPVPMPEVVSHIKTLENIPGVDPKTADITNEDIDTAINVGLSGGPGTLAGVKSLQNLIAAGEPGVEKSISNLQRAMSLEERGAQSKEIWQKTGWEKGADNRWKFEIPDEGSTFKTDKLTPTKSSMENLEEFKNYTGKNSSWMWPDGEPSLKYQIPKEGLPLKDIFDHPELYKHYPELADVTVKPVSGMMAFNGIEGSFNQRTNVLSIGDLTADRMKAVALHEIQHYIQSQEGFSRGGNSKMFESPRWQELNKRFETFKDQVALDLEADYPGNARGKYFDFKEAIRQEPNLPALKQEIDSAPGPISKKLAQDRYDRITSHLKDAKDKGYYDAIQKINRGEEIAHNYEQLAFNNYEAIKGETEARNIETRMNFDPMERWSKTPESTESVPRNRQIWSPLDPKSLTDRQ